MHYGEVKDVFISYRREDGATAARLLCDALERRNISTFFDKETIEGDFHESIKSNLAAARNVLVVVSAKMFSRCLLEDGSYDQAAVQGDWVYEELRISLESGKKIIPVFVNGVTGFPVRLPNVIEKIAAFDALKLDHEHFDAEMAKLIGRLDTPKNQLLNAYMQTEKEFGEGDYLDRLTSSCLKLSVGNEPIIEAFLKKTLKTSWEQSAPSDGEALDILLDGATPLYLKKLSKNLDLDDTGGSRRMKKNILAWLKQDHDSVRKFNEAESENDRLNQVMDAFASVYRSTSDRQLIIEQIVEVFDVEMEGFRRSSSDVFLSVFLDIDVKDFFAGMAKAIPEDNVKDICLHIFGEDRGRKAELIERIVNYTNYEYSPENLDELSDDD